MAPVLRHEVAGEELDFVPAVAAGRRFHPKKVFDLGLFGTAPSATRSIESSDFIAKSSH